MDSNLTLHDFVLNLITNQDARLAFELDPEGSLHAAGLGGITPADVHDVVPLVFDTVNVAGPVQGLTSLPGLSSLPALPNLPAALPIPAGLPAALPPLSALPVVGALAGDLPANLPTPSFQVETHSHTTTNVTGDLGGTLDVGHPGDVLGGAGGLLPGLGGVDATVHPVTSVVGDVTGSLTGDLTGSLTGDLTGNLTGGLSGTLHGVGNLTGGITGSLGLGGSGVSADAHTSTDGHLHGGLLGGITDILH